MSHITNRDALLKLLTLVKPALSTQNHLPALTHFQFLDGWVTAFNDESAISARCGVELNACVPGDLMLRALSSFNGEQVNLSDAGGTLTLSSGRSKLKLPMLSVEDFPYDDECQIDSVLNLTEDIIGGIKRCLFSVGKDSTHPAQRGITLDTSPEGMAVLYSTDNYTISKYVTTAKLELPADAPIILPTFFCEQIVTLSKVYAKDGRIDVDLQICADRLVIKFGKHATLTTRITIDEEAPDFERVLNKQLDMEALPDALIPIPASLDAAFNRALLVLSADVDKATEVTVSKGSITLDSDGGMGSAEDEIEWKGKALSKPFFVDPSLVTRAIKTCGSVAFYNRALVLASDDATFVHLITHKAG